MRVRFPLLAVALAAAFSGSAWGQEAYPTRPVKLVVGYPPGGQTDVLGRIIARGLTQQVGQQVVVENLGGAGGTIGASGVAKAAPDGYTLLTSVEATQSRAKVFFPNAPYDQLKSFTFLRKMALQRALLVVNPASPIRSVADLLAAAKANPRQLNYGGTTGTTSHLGGSIFDRLNGTEMTFVSYAGGNQLVTDLMVGVLQVGFFTESVVAELVKAGKLRALAVVSKDKSVTFPELPTIEEAGGKPMDISAWFGVVGPAGLPPAVVDRLVKALDRVAESPDFAAQIQAVGAVPIRNSDPATFRADVTREIAYWDEWAKDSKTP